MKKIMTMISSAVLVLPFVASAAHFEITPGSGVYTKGQNVTASVYVVPDAGEVVTAAKMKVSFSADKLDLITYSPVSGAPVIGRVGTVIDKLGAVIADNFGFHPGLNAKTKVATITFKAKSTGVATVKMAQDALLLDASNSNKNSGVALASYTLVKPAPVNKPAPKRAPRKPAASAHRPAVNTAPAQTQEETAQQEATTTENTDTTLFDDTTTGQDNAGQDNANLADGQQAAAAGASSYNWLWWLLALILLALAGFFIFGRKKKGDE